MLELFDKVFSAYGHVLAIPSRHREGVVEFQWRRIVALDKSFSFLITKPHRIPENIIKDEYLFMLFLAAYVDCEGCLVIARDDQKLKFVLEIDAEDAQILKGIIVN
jgi:hypothetical protein